MKAWCLFEKSELKPEFMRRVRPMNWELLIIFHKEILKQILNPMLVKLTMSESLEEWWERKLVGMKPFRHALKFYYVAVSQKREDVVKNLIW